MGNDGGSIPDRRDLVRNKPKAEQADKANQTRARWFFCALSKLPLQDPIVSCALGKLYNKSSILEYLLDKKSAYGDAQEICGHIRSLKDVRTLKLTHNPAATTASTPSGNGNHIHITVARMDGDPASDRAPFVCPLTMKEMNGSQPFVYLSTCGCVFSAAGFKTVTGVGAGKEKQDEKDKDWEGTAEEKDHEKTEKSTEKIDTSKDLCPQCGTKYSRAHDIVPLNPSSEIQQGLRFEMEKRRLAEAQVKANSKKRKVKEGGVGAEGQDEQNGNGAKRKKKEEEDVIARPHMHPGMTAASRAVASSLAIEEAKRKAGMSDAVKSIYEGRRDAKKEKETFMTMGTFTRYA